MTPVPFVLMFDGRIIDSAETEEEALQRSEQWKATGAKWFEIHSPAVERPELAKELLSKR